MCTWPVAGKRGARFSSWMKWKKQVEKTQLVIQASFRISQVFALRCSTSFHIISEHRQHIYKYSRRESPGLYSSSVFVSALSSSPSTSRESFMAPNLVILGNFLRLRRSGATCTACLCAITLSRLHQEQLRANALPTQATAILMRTTNTKPKKWSLYVGIAERS